MQVSKKQIIGQIRRWQFKTGLEELENAYKAARSAPEQDKDNLEKKWQQLEADIKSGTQSLTEEDDDGQVVFDWGDHFYEAQSQIDATLSIVREAFCISLNHFWERQIKIIASIEKYDEEKVLKFLLDAKVNPDEENLRTLRQVSNLIKHDNLDAARPLYKRRPDLFDKSKSLSNPYKPSYDDLRINDPLMVDLFSAVSKSYPI